MDRERHLRSLGSTVFAEWHFVELDQRAFLDLGLEFSRAAYERIWREAGEEPGYDDGPEQIDVFEERVRGLHEADYVWMLLAAVLREAVTGFEVYLEKAREEILRHQGRPVEIPDRSPEWGVLVKFFASIGAEVDEPDVRKIRNLRHFLAHRRGELRTVEQRKQFASGAGPFQASNAELSEESVLAAMDTLVEVVVATDERVHLFTWGGRRLG
jgi:hypothetical protein